MREMKTDKLDAIVARFETLDKKVQDPEVIADNKAWAELCRERSELMPIVDKYEEYKKLQSDHKDALEMQKSDDSELAAFAKEECAAIEERTATVIEELKILLLPKDPYDGKDAILEIRPAAGGEEAALFAAELCRMYKMYAEQKRWKVEDISANMTELGGVKEAVFDISGKDVFSFLKFESGVHRVQRVPVTETQGRVHTSTVTVAVLPEAETVDIDINEKDLKIDTYRSSGAGGQHINKTDSAIRITHLPTGIVVTCQDQRSQTKNKERAMQVLATKLYDYFQGQKDEEYASLRKGQVGTGDRSERIRTYNFPQGRVTDHRIGFTLYSIDEFMNGDLDKMVEALRLADQTRRLENE
ncbi:MAG: peptide chain release factor 1 [Clostridiales bacterium]|nr:peptide chain release factor 1 [Clostridiales bacterium]